MEGNKRNLMELCTGRKSDNGLATNLPTQVDSLSTGFLPVISSRSTTPKEYTSDFSVSLPVDAYSGAMYLNPI